MEEDEDSKYDRDLIHKKFYLAGFEDTEEHRTNVCGPQKLRATFADSHQGNRDLSPIYVELDSATQNVLERQPRIPDENIAESNTLMLALKDSEPQRRVKFCHLQVNGWNWRTSS
jgi:hypothetical protein